MLHLRMAELYSKPYPSTLTILVQVTCNNIGGSATAILTSSGLESRTGPTHHIYHSGSFEILKMRFAI